MVTESSILAEESHGQRSLEGYKSMGSHTLLCLYYVDLAVVEDAEPGYYRGGGEEIRGTAMQIRSAQAVGMALDRGCLHRWKPRGRRDTSIQVVGGES